MPIFCSAIDWRETPQPPPLPATHPALIRDLCDVHTEESIYIWHKLVWDGMSDLDPRQCGTASEGGYPDWWANAEYTDLDHIFPPQMTTSTYKGHTFQDGWIRWGLENSIAPGQPFLLRIDEPHPSWSGDGELEWTYELIRKTHRTPGASLRAWEGLLKKVHKHCDRLLERQALLRKLQDTDISSLSLKSEHYCVYDDSFLSEPEGLRVSLCSAHHLFWTELRKDTLFPYPIISGEDPEGDFARAFRNLLKNVQKYRPAINLSAVIALAAGRAGITRWERLTWDLFDPV